MFRSSPVYAKVCSVILAGVAVMGCSKSSPTEKTAKGRVIVALTIDWEGAYLSPEGLDAVDELRDVFGTAPLTHFISAGYFTKAAPDPSLVQWVTEGVRPGDEVAVHLHAWKSLAVASAIEPKLSPSFLTGTDKLLEFEDGDVGFDIDLDAYSVGELRALLRTSRRLLEQTRLPLTTTFRAGGYLGTPKVLQALQEEGFTVDSSATDHRQLEERKNDVLPARVKAIWPNIDVSTQPFFVSTPRGQLLEMPIAAFADYAEPAEIVAIFEAAHARLAKDPTRDQFIVLGFHQETCVEFGPRLRTAFEQIQKRPELAKGLSYMTIEQAATQVRAAHARAPQ